MYLYILHVHIICIMYIFIHTACMYIYMYICIRYCINIIRGYQQCLASIVGSLVGNRLPGGVSYRVDQPLMKRLQVLLKDGNVDG